MIGSVTLIQDEEIEMRGADEESIKQNVPLEIQEKEVFILKYHPWTLAFEDNNEKDIEN